MFKKTILLLEPKQLIKNNEKRAPKIVKKRGVCFIITGKNSASIRLKLKGNVFVELKNGVDPKPITKSREK